MQAFQGIPRTFGHARVERGGEVLLGHADDEAVQRTAGPEQELDQPADAAPTADTDEPGSAPDADPGPRGGSQPDADPDKGTDPEKA